MSGLLQPFSLNRLNCVLTGTSAQSKTVGPKCKLKRPGMVYCASRVLVFAFKMNKLKVESPQHWSEFNGFRSWNLRFPKEVRREVLKEFKLLATSIKVEWTVMQIQSLKCLATNLRFLQSSYQLHFKPYPQQKTGPYTERSLWLTSLGPIVEWACWRHMSPVLKVAAHGAHVRRTKKLADLKTY